MSKSNPLFTIKRLRRNFYQCIAVSFLLCLSGCGKTQGEETVSTPSVVIKTFPVAETAEPLPTETKELSTESETSAPTWQSAYRAFLDRVKEEQPDLKFTLLYLDEDDIPELCFYLETCVDVYSYKDNAMFYAFRFQTGYYSYGFSYRPYQCMVASQQGSVMSDGTYIEVEVFERTEEGFIRSGRYGFSDTPHTIEALKTQGYYTDDEEILEELDIYEHDQQFLGDSWISYQDYGESEVTFYEMTEENIIMLLEGE